MQSENTSSLVHSVVNTFTSDIDDVFFNPALRNAISYDCMIGYFNSSSFQIIAKSLLIFLKSNLDTKMRFIVSPNLSKDDLQIILKWYKDPKLIRSILNDFHLDEESIKKNTLYALAYLINENKIEIKIALPKSGLFHVKSWIFQQKNGSYIVIHGSSNHTYSGLSSNFEYLVLENSLNSIYEKSICLNIQEDFNSLWNNQFKKVICGYLTKDIIDILLEVNKNGSNIYFKKKEIIENLEKSLSTMNKPDDNSDVYNELKKLLAMHIPNQLNIPSWFQYRDGDYKHQGEAIDTWFKNNSHGILSIATGGGKTLTSLTAASLLNQEVDKLLVIIAVPTVALMQQWANEVSLFNVKAINTNKLDRTQKNKLIKECCRQLRFNSSKSEVIIVTHDALQSELVDNIKKHSQDIPTLLIADEVHNLGRAGFVAKAPVCFNYKLGLSATPVRQFDEEGTNFLFEYFGNIIYEFPLEKAIGSCLVEYNYFVHVSHLTAEEEDKFYEISKKIKKLSYAAYLNKETEEFKLWSNLCIQRRRIIETANNKTELFFEKFLSSNDYYKYTLIFCSDKDPKQLNAINSFLQHNHINFHQITSEETSNPQLLEKTIADYNKGLIQVLTSKRVLDEGFNVPSTKNAYILASNTTKRQWIQRLGRVLRKAPNKTVANIHDFVVLPVLDDNPIDDEFKSLLKSEADRINFFIKYSRSNTDTSNAVSTLTYIANILTN